MSVTSWMSVTTKLAPKAFEAQTLAIWLLADATSSQAINAQIARFYTPQTEGAYYGIVGGVCSSRRDYSLHGKKTDS